MDNTSQSASVPVPKQYAGQWIAWDRARTKIVASGRTFVEAREAAIAAGEKDPVLSKVPKADVRFIGGGNVRALIRSDQKNKGEEKLEALLLEGLNSGEPIEASEQYWEKKRRKLMRHQEKAEGK